MVRLESSFKDCFRRPEDPLYGVGCVEELAEAAVAKHGGVFESGRLTDPCSGFMFRTPEAWPSYVAGQTSMEWRWDLLRGSFQQVPRPASPALPGWQTPAGEFWRHCAMTSRCNRMYQKAYADATDLCWLAAVANCFVRKSRRAGTCAYGWIEKILDLAWAVNGWEAITTLEGLSKLLTDAVCTARSCSWSLETLPRWGPAPLVLPYPVDCATGERHVEKIGLLTLQHLLTAMDAMLWDMGATERCVHDELVRPILCSALDQDLAHLEASGQRLFDWNNIKNVRGEAVASRDH